MKKLMMTTMAGVFAASMSFAAITTDAIVSDFQAQGFTRVEVKVGPTQMKVEAIRGAEKDVSFTALGTCETCAGNGAEPGSAPIGCPQCNGTGEVRQVLVDCKAVVGQVSNIESSSVRTGKAGKSRWPAYGT